MRPPTRTACFVSVLASGRPPTTPPTTPPGTPSTEPPCTPPGTPPAVPASNVSSAAATFAGESGGAVKDGDCGRGCCEGSGRGASAWAAGGGGGGGGGNAEDGGATKNALRVATVCGGSSSRRRGTTTIAATKAACRTSETGTSQRLRPGGRSLTIPASRRRSGTGAPGAARVERGRACTPAGRLTPARISSSNEPSGDSTGKNPSRLMGTETSGFKFLAFRPC